MNYRIGMTFDPHFHVWRVSQCYEGNGPVPMVRTYQDGSKELFLSAPYPCRVGDPLLPCYVLHAWQNHPRRQRALTAWKAAHAPFDFQFRGGKLREVAHA